MWLQEETHLSFMGALLWKMALQVNKQVCSCTAKKCWKKLSICQWVCLRRLTGVCMFVLSGLSERAGGGGGGGSRTEDTWLFTREEKKWAEKCWGRISSRLFNSSLWMCVCLSETCCQKPLLTAPLASHDFVMSEEEREKKEITEKKKEATRGGEMERGGRGKTGWKEKECGGRDKRGSCGDVLGEALCTSISAVHPYEQLKCKGGIREGRKLGWRMSTELEQDPWEGGERERETREGRWGGRRMRRRRKGETWSRTKIEDRKRHKSARRKRKDRNRGGGRADEWRERGWEDRGEAVAWVRRKVKREGREK